MLEKAQMTIDASRKTLHKIWVPFQNAMQAETNQRLDERVQITGIDPQQLRPRIILSIIFHSKNGAAHIIFPEKIALGGPLEKASLWTIADQCAAVWQPLGAGDILGEKCALGAAGVLPDRACGSKSGARLRRWIMAIFINGWDNLIHGRITPSQTFETVVENQDMPGAIQPVFNPLGIVLNKKLLVFAATSTIGLRIDPAPARLKVSALLTASCQETVQK